jgi:hypothetical protein
MEGYGGARSYLSSLQLSIVKSRPHPATQDRPSELIEKLGGETSPSPQNETIIRTTGPDYFAKGTRLGFSSPAHNISTLLARHSRHVASYLPRSNIMTKDAPHFHSLYCTPGLLKFTFSLFSSSVRTIALCSIAFPLIFRSIIIT